MPTSPIIVLTGATNGLGRLAAVELAKHGSHLVIIARNASKADETRALVDQAAPGSACEVFLADLAVMDDVRRVGKEIAARYDHIDVLINNAGIHAFEQRITCDGFPEMMAVNYFAPWLLTQALRDVLVRSAPARVVNVASGASKRHGVLTLPDDLINTAPFTTLGSSPIYGKTKLLDIMFSQQLARELAGTNVTVNALCPGFNVTGLGRELWFANALERILNFVGVGDPRHGAGIIVYLAVDPELEDKTGGYYSVDRSLQTPVAPGGDVELQKKLWDLTEGLLKKWLPVST
jgi:NAD(P)-dependent dehydrogenase (short-subunit alcohol dehydrogenase family)